MRKIRILVLRLSSIGDIVLTTAAIRGIRKAHPNAELHYATKKQYLQLLTTNPYIDKLWDYQELNASLTAFDLIVDLHRNLRTTRLKAILAPISLSYDKGNLEKWIAVRTKDEDLNLPHIVNRYYSALAPLGVVDDGEGLDLFIDEETAEVQVIEEPYLSLSISGSFYTKRLPLKELKELVALIKKPLALLGGKGEEAIGEELAEQHPERITNYCGRTSLQQTAYIIQHSQGVVTHDTGTMHIAAALKKPICSIWGNTIPGFGMYPYFGHKHKDVDERSLIIQIRSLSCRPCSKLGYSSCPQGHFKCMRLQDLQAIAAWAKSI